jgi:hypothetical protein
MGQKIDVLAETVEARAAAAAPETGARLANRGRAGEDDQMDTDSIQDQGPNGEAAMELTNPPNATDKKVEGVIKLIEVNQAVLSSLFNHPEIFGNISEAAKARIAVAAGAHEPRVHEEAIADRHPEAVHENQVERRLVEWALNGLDPAVWLDDNRF